MKKVKKDHIRKAVKYSVKKFWEAFSCYAQEEPEPITRMFNNNDILLRKVASGSKIILINKILHPSIPQKLSRRYFANHRITVLDSF